MKPVAYPENEIVKWSLDRNLLQTTTLETQTLKFMEEFGEFCAAYLRGDKVRAEDSLGDMYVVMVQMAKLVESNLSKCAWMAYGEIKDRKGMMVNGSFIKEEDLKN
jgi:hypothetical protein